MLSLAFDSFSDTMLEMILYMGRMYISSKKNGIMFEKIKAKSSLTYSSVLNGTRVTPMDALLMPDFVRKIWLATQFCTIE
jgi:hypothetical protein